MAKIQNTDDTNGSKYVELQELSSIAGGNAVILEYNLEISYKNRASSYHCTLWIYSKELKA